MSIHPFHLESSFQTDPIPFVSYGIVDMTSLFRPWTEQNAVENTVEEMTTLIPQDPESRESKYKSVKEHIKKRSEKYMMKKLRSQTEKKPVETVASEYPQMLEVSGVPFATPCCPPINPFECFIPATPTIPLPNGDLLETAISQGFPPNLFEEYARYLTEQQKQAADRTRKQRPKKFRCPHCQVGFSNNGQLKGHIRIHTGERPFKCDAESCGKSFTRNEELTRHRRIHSGLRPFPCTECGKRFGRKDHLKKHIKTHFQQRYQLVPIIPSHYPYFYGL